MNTSGRRLAERTARVKAAATRLGFDAVGIARADTLGPDYVRYRQWLDKGYHATLAYMDRNYDKREDPRRIVPGARSLVVVGQNYYTPHQHDASSDGGKIARYAWGDDYHDVMPPRLRSLASVLQEIDPEAESRVYTDTGPVLEKQWAVRAGLGWQGKHSNVISRSIGSWFFIGVVISTIELEADSPIEDYCGTCSACIDACPTNAIVEPYVVDAGKCLSYWTIETKPDVEIPLTIVGQMEGWLFGCDICQDVCPWNRFQQDCGEERFEPRLGETELSGEYLESLRQEDFSTRFRKSPLKRSKLAGLQRNARAVSTWRRLTAYESDTDQSTIK